MHRETVEVVATHALFRRLAQSHKAQLLRVMQEEEISANTLIFQEDAQGDSLYLVVKGTVLLQREVDNDPVPLIQLQKGESFGDIAVLTPGNRLLTAKAIESGYVVRLSHEALQKLQATAPEAVLAIRTKILEHFLIKIRNLEPVWQHLLLQGVTALDGKILGRGR